MDFDLKEYIREIVLEELDAREGVSSDPVMITLQEAARKSRRKTL